MSLYDSIEQRITDIADSSIEGVGSALSLAMALKQTTHFAVQVFVIPIQERPGENQRVTGPALQAVTDVFGVLFAVRVLNDTDGQRAKVKLQSARDEVRAALFGWRPDGASLTCELAASDLVQMEPGQIWWLDRFTTEHHEIAPQ